MTGGRVRRLKNLEEPKIFFNLWRWFVQCEFKKTIKVS